MGFDRWSYALRRPWLLSKLWEARSSFLGEENSLIVSLIVIIGWVTFSTRFYSIAVVIGVVDKSTALLVSKLFSYLFAMVVMCYRLYLNLSFYWFWALYLFTITMLLIGFLIPGEVKIVFRSNYRLVGWLCFCFDCRIWRELSEKWFSILDLLS